MIEQRGGIIGKHFDGISLYRLARFTRAAVVEYNHSVIAGKLSHLMKLPGLMIAAGHAAKEKRRTITVDFIIDIGVFHVQIRHGDLTSVVEMPQDMTMAIPRQQENAKRVVDSEALGKDTALTGYAALR